VPKIHSCFFEGTLVVGDDNAEIKKLFHKESKKLLKVIAEDLGLENYEIRNNRGGPAVSGEIILHGDRIYMYLFSEGPHRGASLLYRGCKSSRDYCGGTNHFAEVTELGDPGYYARFLDKCQKLIRESEVRSGQ
jgi:hypothetical protein